MGQLTLIRLLSSGRPLNVFLSWKFFKMIEQHVLWYFVTEAKVSIVAFLTAFLRKNLFLFPLVTANDVLTNRRSGDKMFVSAVTPPMYWRI